MEAIFFFNDTTNKPTYDYSTDNKSKGKTRSRIVNKDFFTENEVHNVTKLTNTLTNYTECCIVYDSVHRVGSNIIYKGDSDDDSDDSDYDIPLDAAVFRQTEQLLFKLPSRHIILFNNYLKPFKPVLRKYIYSLVLGWQRLQDILLKLHNGPQLVVNHVGSLVVDVDSEQVYLTNFSFAIDIGITRMDLLVDKFKHLFAVYSPEFTEWPLEFHFLAYLTSFKLTSLSSYNIQHIISEYAEHNQVLKSFGPAIVEKYVSNAKHYFEKYVNKTFAEIVEDCTQFWDTWDMYMFGVYWLRMLIELHKELPLNKKKNKFIIEFMKLLVQQIEFDPTKRVRGKIERVFDKCSLNDYKMLLR